MIRILTACLAMSLVPTLAAADEMKPKFGDIDGVYYTDVAYDRAACRQAVKNKIALCRQNTGFISNTEDRNHPGCLPIFRAQARICADHFRSEAYKCEGSGSARIEDFTGFGCTVTETTVEEGGEGEPWEAEAAADPWADDYGTAADDPWAPEAAPDDPWALDDAVPATGSGADGPLTGRDRAAPGTGDFDYNAALRALDGADGMDRRALPEHDYTARLEELERREAARREAEIAREAERQAERLREEEVAARRAAERRARQEAEEAGRRAALERETVEDWQESDDSYETYESGSADDTLFGGGEAGQQAFEDMLEGNIPSMGQEYGPRGTSGTYDGDYWRSSPASGKRRGGSECVRGASGRCRVGSIQ